ncbi:basic amino acid ABC transporter substrate-binding protein [Clostridia bacterium]|nr:basic amino acid ABC transporter substrate-binding protein [Clostridia bacterium]
MSVFGGCSKAAEKTDVGLLNADTLKVGMEIGYPPFELFADDGVTPIGLDVDLANALAKELGVKVDLQNTAWDGIFTGLDIDKYDVVISAATIDPDRKLVMDFSDPYIKNWQSIVVRKDSAPITSVQGLAGLKVGYQESTTSDDYLNDLIDSGAVSKVETFEYDKVTNVFDDLKLGRLDAVICDSVVSDGYILRDPDSFVLSWIQSSEPGAEAEEFGVAVKKGNTKLKTAIDAALKKLKDNGELDKILNNWLS